MKSPWNFSKFELLMYFKLYKAANFYKIPQEIWLTLSQFTGRHEQKDALILVISNILNKKINFVFWISWLSRGLEIPYWTFFNIPFVYCLMKKFSTHNLLWALMSFHKGRCHKHLRWGVYQFGPLRAPDADPPIFGQSHLDPLQKSVPQCSPPQNRLLGRHFLEENFLFPPQKKAKY